MRRNSQDPLPDFLILNKDSINQFYLSLILKENQEHIGYGLNAFIGNFAVRQSLLRYSMSLELSIHDGVGLVDKSILKMGNILELYLCRDLEHPESAKLIKTFYITNIDSSIQPLTQNERVYDITAYTFAGVSNAWPFTNVYPAGEKPSDIIKDIVKKKFTAKPEEVGVSNGVPELHWVPTENTLDTPTIFKQVAPFDAITNMLRRSTGPANDSTYFFYEDLEGFKLRTLGDMLPDNPANIVTTYTMTPDKKPTGNTFTDFYKILYLTQHNNSDYFNIIESGVYSSEVVYIDLANRTIGNENKRHVFDFEANTQYKDTILSNNYEGFDTKTEVFGKKGIPDPGSSVPSDTYDFTPASKIVFSEKAWDRIDYMHNKYPFDSAQRALFEQNKISIEVYGNPEIKPGDVIDIKLPKNNQEEGLSTRISGAFLVTGVKHNVKGNMFQTIVDLHKDSYENNVFEGTKDNRSTLS